MKKIVKKYSKFYNKLAKMGKKSEKLKVENYQKVWKNFMEMGKSKSKIWNKLLKLSKIW